MVFRLVGLCLNRQNVTRLTDFNYLHLLGRNTFNFNYLHLLGRNTTTQHGNAFIWAMTQICLYILTVWSVSLVSSWRSFVSLSTFAVPSEDYDQLERLCSSLFASRVCKIVKNTVSWFSCKYSSVFRENRCPKPPKPVYGGNFSHEALKIRSRSPKSNKLLILSDLYRLANLVTLHPMIHEITCRQTLFGLILMD